MNYLKYNQIEVGKLYQCISATYDNEFIINGPVLVIRKLKRSVKLLYNTKIVAIFSGDDKFSII